MCFLFPCDWIALLVLYFLYLFMVYLALDSGLLVSPFRLSLECFRPLIRSGLFPLCIIPTPHSHSPFVSLTFPLVRISLPPLSCTYLLVTPCIHDVFLVLQTAIMSDSGSGTVFEVEVHLNHHGCLVGGGRADVPSNQIRLSKNTR